MMNTIQKTLAGLVALASLAVATVAADGPKQFPVGEFQFTRPAAWEWVEVTSSMRKAQLKVPDKESAKSAEVVFFSGFGGSVKDNVDRWYAQFEEGREKIGARTEEVQAGKHKVTYAHAEGTYLSGMPGGPRTPLKGHALLGAIIESDKGNIFVRMTGPADLVKSATPEFRKMIEGALK
jgi:hypothetical protein